MPSIPRFKALCLSFLAAAAPVLADEIAHPTAPGSAWDFHGYSTINYYHFDWQTDPSRRDAVDLERMAIETQYRVSDRIRANAEIEFEHGGTGATMELDKLEESGEFESEVEKGGEVTLEELNVSFLLDPAFNVRVGHFFVPIGFAYTLDEPTEYLTVERSEAERAVIPVSWDETGVEINGQLPGFRYQIQMINGLDATGFSSGGWVALGHQGRFETVNAENWAWAGRLETNAIPHAIVGISGYFGNSTDNRPKPDLQADAYVGILSGHAQWRSGPFLIRGLGIWGHLSNSEAVSQRNQLVSSALEVKRTPVGSQAYAAFAEAGVDVLRLAKIAPPDQSGTVFVRVDSYDTMLRTQGAIYDDPKWEHLAWTGGVNYAPHPQVVLKGEYSHRVNGNDQDENTLSLGLGLVFF